MDERSYKEKLNKIKKNFILMDECNKTLKRIKKTEEIMANEEE